jgi:hypothetical protein
LNIDTIVIALKAERERITRAIAALEDTASPTRAGRVAAPSGGKKRRRRKMSAQAKQRLSQMKKKWWAKRKREAA